MNERNTPAFLPLLLSLFRSYCSRWLGAQRLLLQRSIPMAAASPGPRLRVCVPGTRACVTLPRPGARARRKTRLETSGSMPAIALFILERTHAAVAVTVDREHHGADLADQRRAVLERRTLRGPRHPPRPSRRRQRRPKEAPTGRRRRG